MDSAPTIQLTDHQWSQRVLIVFASKSDVVERQLNDMEQESQAFAQRDLVVYIVPSQREASITQMKPSPTGAWVRANVRLDPRPKRSMYNIPEDAFGVVLIGKDGGTKLTTNDERLTNTRLFSTIDAMPMRQREMKSQD